MYAKVKIFGKSYLPDSIRMDANDYKAIAKEIATATQITTEGKYKIYKTESGSTFKMILDNPTLTIILSREENHHIVIEHEKEAVHLILM